MMHKILEIYAKYFTASDYNKVASEILDAKVKEKWLVDQFGISGFIYNPDLDQKIAKLEPQAELKTEQDKIMNRQAFNLSYFLEKGSFQDDGMKNHLVFQPVYW